MNLEIYLLYQYCSKTRGWLLWLYHYSCTFSSIHQIPFLVVVDQQVGLSSLFLELLVALLASRLSLVPLSYLVYFSPLVLSLLYPFFVALDEVLHTSLL